MRVLLDTHIALWAVLKTERLSPETKEYLQDPFALRILYFSIDFMLRYSRLCDRCSALPAAASPEPS